MRHEPETTGEDGHAVPADQPAPRHRRPPGVDDATVEAAGTVTTALEAIERARGHLYAFHQLTGTADRTLITAVEQLRQAGHTELAATLERDLVGRNVLPGRWTFQIVEDYDDGYYATFRAHERRVRDELLAGHRHVYEAEMKETERSTDEHGRPLPGHAATPSTETTGEPDNRTPP